jgi:hypothetical protein
MMIHIPDETERPEVIIRVLHDTRDTSSSTMYKKVNIMNESRYLVIGQASYPRARTKDK